MTGLPRHKGITNTALFTLWGGKGIKNKVWFFMYEAEILEYMLCILFKF